MHNRYRVYRVYRAVQAALLLFCAACAAPAADGGQATGPRCVLVQQPARTLERAPTLRVDTAASPPHCHDARVQADFRAAMRWYQAQARQIQANLAYPPAMLHELETYYTGDLLHQARESIYYNQQAGRIVAARWQAISRISGPRWHADGQQATLSVSVPGYERFNHPPPQAGQVVALPARPLESWQVTMLYDGQDERWKIQDAATLFDF